jgi:hypothetical protein
MEFDSDKGEVVVTVDVDNDGEIGIRPVCIAIYNDCEEYETDKDGNKIKCTKTGQCLGHYCDSVTLMAGDSRNIKVRFKKPAALNVDMLFIRLNDSCLTKDGDESYPVVKVCKDDDL